MRFSKRRCGFTILELMVALAIGALAILGARTILTSLADQTDVLTGVTADLDRVANGERILRSLVGSIEISSDPGAGFAGGPGESSFTTWCDTAGGWQERCRVRLVIAPIDSVDTGHVLAAIFEGGDGTPLIAASREMRLLYLGDAANGGTWYSNWARGLSIPLAIGVVTARDTLIVRIGQRG